MAKKHPAPSAFLLGRGEGVIPPEFAVPTPASPSPPSRVNLTATVASAAKASSSLAEARGRFLVGVQLFTNTTTVGGSIYARVLEVIDGSDTGRVVWAGHVRDNATVASVPNTKTSASITYRLDVWGIASSVGRIVTARLLFADEATNGTFIHYEEPGSGVGTFETETITNASPWDKTLPGGEIWRVQSFGTTFTADVNAANRYIRIVYYNPTTPKLFAGTLGSDAIVALDAIGILWSIGATAGHVGGASGFDTRALPDFKITPELTAPARISVYVANKQAGDAFDRLDLTIEKWASPTTA